MNELSALITSRFNDISAPKHGKQFSEDEQPNIGFPILTKQRSPTPPRRMESLLCCINAEQRSTAVVDAFQQADGCNDGTALLTWYPAPEFLALEHHKAYSFAVPNIPVDAATTDGAKFTQILEALTAQLEQHIATANLLLSVNEKIPQFGGEVEEDFRVAIGRTHLLLNKRIKQFREQLGRHLNPIPWRLLTKLDDLHGLWALIDMQLEDIRTCFNNIEQCRLRGWVIAAAGDE